MGWGECMESDISRKSNQMVGKLFCVCYSYQTLSTPGGGQKLIVAVVK